MMRIVMVLIAAAALLLSAPAEIVAQHATGRYSTRADAQRTVDLFLSHHRLSSENGGQWDASGAGGRVMWSLAPFAHPTGLPLLDRMSAGGYLVHTLGTLERREVWHYGVQTDVRLTAAPLAGRVHPIVSFGVGAIHAEKPARISLLSPPERVITAAPESPRAATSSSPMVTTLSLTPGIGARVRVMPGLDLRSDLRSMIDLRDEGRRHLELSGGISVSL